MNTAEFLQLLLLGLAVLMLVGTLFGVVKNVHGPRKGKYRTAANDRG